MERGNLFYLPVSLDVTKPLAFPAEVVGCLSAVKGAVGPQQAENWKFFEYCCAGDSALTQWFMQRGLAAQRLGLPDHDMSQRHEIDNLVQELKRRALQKQRSMVWAALTCTPWCAWQQ